MYGYMHSVQPCLCIAYCFSMSKQGGKLKPLKKAKGAQGGDDDFDKANKERIAAEKKAMAEAAKKLKK